MSEVYVVYRTTYTGNCGLPPYYIGSTSLRKLCGGYRGSVGSREWSKLFKKEVQEKPELFKVEVVKYFNERLDALLYESELQTDLDVVHSEDYMNKSIASANGIFGQNQKGVSNPRYGNEVSLETKTLISNANKGKVSVKDTKTGLRVRINCADFCQDAHETLQRHTEDSIEKIAKNTSKSMSKLVSQGAHWFQTVEHKSLVSSMRNGAIAPQEVRKKLSEARLKLFDRPWLLEEYSDFDFKSLGAIIFWYNTNYRRRSTKSKKLFVAYLESLLVNETRQKWLIKALSYEDVKSRFEGWAELYDKEEKCVYQK